MSNRLTFSLASLFLIFVAGFAFLTPGIAEAANPTIPAYTGPTELTVQEVFDSIQLPEASDSDAGETIASYELTAEAAAADGTFSGSPSAATLATYGLDFAAGLNNRRLSALGLEGPIKVGKLQFTYTATSTNGSDTAATITFIIDIKTDIAFNQEAQDTWTGTIKREIGQPLADFVLPMATNGSNDPVTYTLTATDSSDVDVTLDGSETAFRLTYTDGLRTLHGTPTLPTGVTAPVTLTMTYTATETGDTVPDRGTAVLTFTLSLEEAATALGMPAVTAEADVESVTLTWTAPSNAPTGAMYEYMYTDGTTPSAWMDGTSPQSVSGLTGGTKYTFSVRVKADPANLAPAGTAGTATATPTSPAPDAPNVTAAAGVESVTLTWTPSDNVAGYEYKYGDGRLSSAWTNGASGVIVDNLDAGTEYTFSVRVKANAAILAPEGAVGTAMATPTSPAPGMPTVTAAAGVESVTLTWTPADNAAGYEHKYTDGTTPSAWMDGASGVMVGNLTGGTEYTFSVRVKANAAIAAPAGAVGTAMATPTSPAPAAPTVTAAAGVESVTLTWTPADNAAGYEHMYTDGTTPSAWMDGASGVMVGNLTGGTEYTFSVRVKANAAIAAPAGAVGTAMATPTSPAPTDQEISQPTNVMAMPQNDGSVMVTWDWTGTDAEMTANALGGFKVTWNPSENVAATAREYTIPADMVLTPGEEITVSVLARAAAGSGFATPAAPTAMAAVTPVDPKALRFALGTTIPDMTFTAGTAIGTTAMPYVQLPQAYGGTGIYTYSLLKGLRKSNNVIDGFNGLSVNDDLRLHGTPTAEDATTLYTWRVTDAQAEDAIELEFKITVNAAPIVTPTNLPPDVMITSPKPPAGAIVLAPSYKITYTATDPNVGDTVNISVASDVAPSTATADYTVKHDATAKTVMITRTQPAPVAVVSVTITGTDTGGLMDSDSVEVSFGPRGPAPPPDTTPPVLVSYSFAVANTNTDQLTLTLMFDEPVNAETIDIDDHNGNGVSQAGPAAAGTATNSYTVLVNAPGYATRAKTYMSLERGLADMSGNETTSDQILTYNSPTPTVPTVAISGPASLNCDTGDRITFTITGTTETLVAGDITIGAGWKMGTDNDPSDGTLDIVPDGNAALGITSVKVDVKANAVGNNAAVSKTFTVGPILTIPAGGYIVVIRPEHRLSTHLRDPLYLGSVGVRGLPIDIQEWECMPDLTTFFGRSGAGLGGGALVVKQSAAHTGAAIGKGSVGISEIMWASDEGTIHGLTSNTNQAREQWVEVHNLNNHEVKVTLFARLTNTALVTESDEIDRASNFEIGNSWVVKGQNGNSALGTDFVSMFRHKNNNNYAHGDNNGKNGGKWNASTLIYRTRPSTLAGRGATNPTHNFKGTPGRSNTISPAGPPVRTNVPNSPVVFNEIANRRDQTLEWIELKNVSDGEVNLRNYHISYVDGVGSEKAFYTFPNNDNTKIPAKGLLLLVDTDPRYNDDHPIAVGRNIHTGNDQALGIGADAPRYMVTNFAEGGLPDNGEFVLMLRRPDGHDKAGTAANKRGTEKNMIDAAGYHPNLKSTGSPLYTNLWPLKVFGAPNDKNKMPVETVHRRQHTGRDPDQVPDNKVENAALRDAGYTGIGYKRHAQGVNAHGGSPGYEHGTQKNLASEISGTGLVTISEIMFDQGDGRYPQWIELYNSSPTQPVNLRGGKTGWKLVIENFDDGEIPVNRLSGTLNFRDTKAGGVHTILPQQTVIVASTRARNSGSAFFDTAVVFPPTRVFSVWDDARGQFDMKRSTDPILSTEGFYIELIDGGNDANPNGYVSDSVGNLVTSPNRRVAHDKVWELSEITGEMMDDMGRSSILRRYRKAEKGKDPSTWMKYTAAELMDLGIMAEGWVAAHQTDFRNVRETWFGHPDDYGSPGITGGRVLPVSLSKFRPERLDDGTIVVRWITESETNNAGFNILRSVDGKGEFTKLNTKLIAGKGTTSERNAYEFVDTSAKPNVVYYYQIQDVSLDGEVATLRVSRLKGHVTAAGKATTTWGELKALQ